MVKLARAFCAEGVTCWVPQLRGLARFTEELSDLQAIIHCVRLAQQGAGQPIAILGFSLGGGYGLVAAADSTISSLVSQITVMSGHHELDFLWRNLADTLTKLESKLSWATDLELFGAYVQARRVLQPGEISEAESAQLDAMLSGYVQGLELSALRAFAKTHLLSHWSRIAAPSSSPHSLELSPAGKLHQVKGNVTLLHSPGDTLVPESEAQRNYAELVRRSSGAQSILCTEMLEHVNPRFTRDLHHVPKLVKAFAELL
jgi:acetyl esterase/lipase